MDINFKTLLLKRFFILTFCLGYLIAFSQPDRWQQRASYNMEIDFDTDKHQYKGKQTLTYTNNSPDEINRVFYHLFFNAFQPNSVMDTRSRTISDPDRRVGDRISKLKPDEIGYIKVNSLRMNGKKVLHKTVGTILEVDLSEPVKSGSTVTFTMEWDAQVPNQIRRSGRNGAEGIDYSMAQWFPKICNYDIQGWHAYPYVAREFYSPWGDYDVKITMPSKYIIAGTGLLQNKDQIGHGYGNMAQNNGAKKLTWHFKAENVHDFVWAADPDYKHVVHKNYDGTIARYFYQPGEKTNENWEKLPKIMDEAFKFLNTKYGKYPYTEYAFIQGGDGGMEYPMATLITGNRPLNSLVGVSVHELIHSWFQMVIATNEALYHWMDEGFTTHVTEEVTNHLKKMKLIPGEAKENPFLGLNDSYINFAKSGEEEAMIIHADHFSNNRAYSVASYVKGAVLLEQLRYLIGRNTYDNMMKVYFETWKFKHPNPNDFFRIVEKSSGHEMDWFKEYFTHTTHQIDYAIDQVQGKTVKIKRVGKMPMPLDVVVTTASGKVFNYYIPLDMMRGVKKGDDVFVDFKVSPIWEWTHPTYELMLDQKPNEIISIEIDPSKRMADVDRSNNMWKKVE